MNHFFTTLLVLLLLAFTSVKPQESKYEGGAHKPAFTEGGNPLHALVVFVTFENDEYKDTRNIWDVNHLPSYAGDLFDEDTSDGIKEYTITDYWYNMSGGRFVFTGEIYPEPVQIRPEAYYSETHRNYGSTNQEVLEIIKEKLDFRKFDNWSYDYREKKFNPEPDGIADMVILIYRNPEAKWFTRGAGEDFSAIALLGNKDYEVISRDNVSIISKPVISNEVSGLTVRTGVKSKMDLIEIISHEYGHFLFKSGHPAIGGIMGGSTFAMNSWEKIALGYVDPVVIKSDTTGIKLNDFLNTDQVIKINYPPELENSNRYFLIENHTRTNKYDYICRGGAAEGKYSLEGNFGKGIYVYQVSSGKHFPPKIEMLTADGRWKWNIIDTVKNSPLCDCDVPVFKRFGPDRDNGKNDREIKIYFNKELWDMWYDTDPYTGELILSRDNMGDEYDAFTEGMVLSQWSNPTSNISKKRISMFGFYVENIDDSGVASLDIRFHDSTKELPPAPPQNLEFKVSGDEINLTWWTNVEPSMQEGSEYILYRKTADSENFVERAAIPHVKSRETKYSDNIEEINTPVLYYVKSKGSSGKISSPSHIIRVERDSGD